MFDPASFFGHSEFELAIMDMFGGFQDPFWASYHAKVSLVHVCTNQCLGFCSHEWHFFYSDDASDEHTQLPAKRNQTAR